MRIAFIGTGIMGRPMAGHLLKAGHAVVLHSRTKEKAEPLLAAGAAWGDTPAQAAREAEVVFTMVPDTKDVERVLFGRGGLFPILREGKIVVDHSTISPSKTREFAARLRAKGAELLDAPVTGGERGAVEATLTIMAGGPKEAFDRCRPLFEKTARKILHVGGSGMGQTVKLMNQIVCAHHIVAVCEALVFARKAGLPEAQALEAISGGAAASWILSNLGPRILARDFRPGFFLKLQRKDLRLVKEALKELRIPLPGTGLNCRLFAKAVREGLGDLGTQGLIKLLDPSY